VSGREAGLGERWAAGAIVGLLGGAAFLVPFVHVATVARWAGQPDWAAWPIAVSIELMAVSSILEIRHRRRQGMSVAWPVGTLLVGVAMSAACNLQAAGPGALSGPPSVWWVRVMALWPVVAFLGKPASWRRTASSSAGRSA
jgi:hypothetical protein